MKAMSLLVAGCWLAGVVLSAPAGAQTPTFDLSAAKAEYKRPPPRPPADPALVDLGRLLFSDPRTSASTNTSRASCHLPYLGWAVTDARSRSDSGKPTSRKSQPLIGIGHAEDSPVGWGARSATLEDQVKASIATGSMSMRQTETPVKVEVIEARFRVISRIRAEIRCRPAGQADRCRRHGDCDCCVRAHP
jgi:cytochrome c peroxidase